MIRPPVPDDGPAIMRMGEAFFHEAGYGTEFPFDRESFAKTVILLAQAGLILVAEQDGRVIGMAAADVAPAFWNHNLLLAREAFWYIEPTHRNGMGRRLFEALEAMVKGLGVTLFDVVAEEGKRSTALARIYRAAGYSPAEHTFRKRLRCQPAQSLVA